MTAELKELRQHVRWLEDERLDAGAVEKHLDEIDDRLNEIHERLDKTNDGLKTLADAFNGIADALKMIADGLNALAPKSPPPPPPPMGDILNEFFKPTNGRKDRPAKPKPRKTKLSIVPSETPR